MKSFVTWFPFGYVGLVRLSRINTDDPTRRVEIARRRFCHWNIFMRNAVCRGRSLLVSIPNNSINYMLSLLTLSLDAITIQNYIRSWNIGRIGKQFRIVRIEIKVYANFYRIVYPYIVLCMCINGP